MINVLIVDDELFMRIGLKAMIDWESYGFRIIGEASNGQEALELAGETSPDLIITDIKMPVMDGLALIREASHLHEDCKFIILSCLDEFQYAQEAVRLGAADYLIKSDVKPPQLLRVLDTVKRRIGQRNRDDGAMPSRQYNEGIGYLRETLFKELISGYRGDHDVLANRDTLRISLPTGAMVLIKLRIDCFEQIRRKYIEQDEKLLRYAIVNIMEEIIPRRRSKEIVTMNSAEYLLIMSQDGKEILSAEEITGLARKIQAAMRDFLNISMSISVSGPAAGFKDLKRAYQEADAALGSLFFERGEGLVFYDSDGRQERNKDCMALESNELRQFRQDTESGADAAEAYLTHLKERLLREGYTEHAARSTYIRMLGAISSCFPTLPELGDNGLTIYEQLLHEDSLSSLHRTAVHYLARCRSHQRSERHLPRSYAEQASEIVMNRYSEDISLQLVADQINVNASYLSRVFKQEMGENFVSFLTRLRVEKAKQLLKDRNVKVYEVAERVGYPNTAYFSKLFKKVTGLSPEEYRG